MAVGASGGCGDRGGSGQPRELGVAGEASDAGDLADQLGRGQRPAAGVGRQPWSEGGNKRGELLLECRDRARELADALELVASDSDARGLLGALFPILRRYSETPSLSYVASRTSEATIIGVGAISLLSVVTLRDDLAASIGAGGTSLDIAGRTLVAIYDWTFMLGPGFCVGVNGILLG